MNLWRRFMNWIHGYGLPLEVEVAVLRCRVDALEKAITELTTDIILIKRNNDSFGHQITNLTTRLKETSYYVHRTAMGLPPVEE